MTPREIIQRNLNRTDPERIGFSFDGGRLNDFVGCGLGPSTTYQPRRWREGNVEYHDDEWGNVWHRLVDRSAGGEIFRPALESWDLLADYELPDLTAPGRFDRAREVFAADGGRFRVASIPGFPFAICRYLRKMEVYFQDLLLHRAEIDLLHERVTSLLEQVIVGMGEAGAEGLTFCEDWGIQDRLLVSPTQWRELFKPLFQRLCGAAHEHGMAVLMHSCGYVWDIIDDLAEVGVNAFQFDQPALYGIERLADKLQSLGCCLWAPVDIQKVLPPATGTTSRPKPGRWCDSSVATTAASSPRTTATSTASASSRNGTSGRMRRLWRLRAVAGGKDARDGNNSTDPRECGTANKHPERPNANSASPANPPRRLLRCRRRVGRHVRGPRGGAARREGRADARPAGSRRQRFLGNPHVGVRRPGGEQPRDGDHR